MSPIDFHRFCAARQRAATADTEAGERYERLAGLTDDPELAGRYRVQAAESRASAARNLDAINARLQGRKAVA